MRCKITPLAGQDIESIGDYIAQDNPHRAFTFTQELREQCRHIADNPYNYRKRDELGDEVRSCAYGRYVIFLRCPEKKSRLSVCYIAPVTYQKYLLGMSNKDHLQSCYGFIPKTLLWSNYEQYSR